MAAYRKQLLWRYIPGRVRVAEDTGDRGLVVATAASRITGLFPSSYF